MMKERKASVSPYHPCADKANNGEPVRDCCVIRGRAKWLEKKSLMSVQIFIEHF
jgi:hypothetical protein